MPPPMAKALSETWWQAVLSRGIHVADFDPIRNGRSRAQKATDNAADNSADFLGYAVGLNGGDDIAGFDVVADVVAAEKNAGLRSEQHTLGGHAHDVAGNAGIGSALPA